MLLFGPNLKLGLSRRQFARFSVVFFLSNPSVAPMIGSLTEFEGSYIETEIATSPLEVVRKQSVRPLVHEMVQRVMGCHRGPLHRHYVLRTSLFEFTSACILL